MSEEADIEEPRPRLELVVSGEHPVEEPAQGPPLRPGQIPFDDGAQRMLLGLSRWVGLTGMTAVAVGGWIGLRYLRPDGQVPQVTAAILSSALGIWLLTAAWRFRQVAISDGRDRHHLINGLGLLRSALLLKALLLFSSMVLSCVAFSLVASLLWV